MNRGRGKKGSEESEHVINHTQDYENAFHKNRKPNQHCYCHLCQPFLPSHESPQSQHGYQPGIWIPCLKSVHETVQQSVHCPPPSSFELLQIRWWHCGCWCSSLSLFDSTPHSPSYFSNTMPMANLFCNVTHGNHKCEQTKNTHKH